MAWRPDYCTVAELSAWARIPDSADDTELGYAVTSAARAIDTFAGRQFGQVDSAEDRVYPAEWDRRRRQWIVTIDDIDDDTDLTVTNDDGDTITGYTLEPRNAVKEGKVWTRLVIDRDADTVPTGTDRLLTIGGLWGWTAVPTAVQLANLIQASRFHTRRAAPFGVAGSPDTGSEMRLLAKVDPDVGVSLTDYVRRWAAA